MYHKLSGIIDLVPRSKASHRKINNYSKKKLLLLVGILLSVLIIFIPVCVYFYLYFHTVSYFPKSGCNPENHNANILKDYSFSVCINDPANPDDRKAEQRITFIGSSLKMSDSERSYLNIALSSNEKNVLSLDNFPNSYPSDTYDIVTGDIQIYAYPQNGPDNVDLWIQNITDNTWNRISMYCYHDTCDVTRVLQNVYKPFWIKPNKQIPVYKHNTSKLDYESLANVFKITSKERISHAEVWQATTDSTLGNYYCLSVTGTIPFVKDGNFRVLSLDDVRRLLEKYVADLSNLRKSEMTYASGSVSAGCNSIAEVSTGTPENGGYRVHYEILRKGIYEQDRLTKPLNEESKLFFNPDSAVLSLPDGYYNFNGKVILYKQNKAELIFDPSAHNMFIGESSVRYSSKRDRIYFPAFSNLISINSSGNDIIVHYSGEDNQAVLGYTALSPSEEYLAFQYSSGAGDILLLNLETNEVTNLTASDAKPGGIDYEGYGLGNSFYWEDDTHIVSEYNQKTDPRHKKKARINILTGEGEPIN